MEISFSNGRFVSDRGTLNYQEVLDDFKNAKTIRIITYNISKNKKDDRLLEAVKHTNADIKLITNVPSRAEEYFPGKAGDHMRSTARTNIQIYISKLKPENFPDQFIPYFNVNNHAKIVGTENIVYIGSANYSNESVKSIEAGILIEDKDFIQRLYDEFFAEVESKSLSYYDECFSAFKVFVMSLQAKFEYHHHKLIQDVYTDYERTKLVVADSIFLDVNDLFALYKDLDELKSVIDAAEDTYDEKNAKYNEALEVLKEGFERIDIEWLQEVISEDGSLYELVNYDANEAANDILQEEYCFDAYEERLDMYAEDAVNSAMETYSCLHGDFSEEADTFLSEIEKILSQLNKALRFAEKWKAAKVNPEIDNTR